MSDIKYKIENNYPITLADLRNHKQEVLKDVRAQQNLLNNRFERIIAPFTRTEGTNPLLNSFNFGVAAIDGIIMGVKTLRKITQFFSKKK